jgi:hypothetical protein
LEDGALRARWTGGVRPKADVQNPLTNVCFWHEADIKLRPLFSRYWVESGHHRLIVSISAFDPSATLVGQDSRAAQNQLVLRQSIVSSRFA